MSKFKRKIKVGSQEISTASLPDIVFMLLFFFMVTTVMRETTVKVAQKMPGATEVKKLEKKSLVSYIYIGKPRQTFQSMYGTEPRIQLNDAFAKVEDIRDYIVSEREKVDENERPFMTTSLKVDQYTKMGVVVDVKQELRKASALKINYSTRKVTELE
ncbi:MAG: biopolymer transporter ExbD [Bacteroidetes bacterium GWC2_33_15]|nr:MAG: biopolymer transporter ExbD [Bacteroidetes bacterium GWA2_33_15]OFX52708.1 MAG: biopolymer transporter ExbD [Bacteroidetes bacterium GWC2_33_15]OFX63986.1 MAG: biopolymer transporter ExbD [Bacteroidetes bacterium GWB2_32_14]OFX67329.1 MAG: biopolymer transporter ExbD [Bacteroidetes bacterium GWD2_33_33]HAN18804.1 biopolymer transporter ExbD [Bacteroidales bacterium]